MAATAIDPQRQIRPRRDLIKKILVAVGAIAVGVFAVRQMAGKTIDNQKQVVAETARAQKVAESVALDPASIANRLKDQEDKAVKDIKREKEQEQETSKKISGQKSEAKPDVPEFKDDRNSATSQQSDRRVAENSPSQDGAGVDHNKLAWASPFTFDEGKKDVPSTVPVASSSFLTPGQIAAAAQTSKAPQLPNTNGQNAALLEAAKNQLGQNNANIYASGQGSLAQVNQKFLDQSANQQIADQAPLRARPKTSDYLLTEEAVIRVALTRKLNSDLPGGGCQGRVIQDVPDSIYGRYILIPQHTKINCVYNAEVLPGQSRMLFAFTRMLFPNGGYVRLGAMPGSDLEGSAGVAANVDNHFWKIFGTSFVIGSVALASSQNNSPSNVTINVGGGGGYGTTSAAQLGTQVLSDTTKRILDRYQNIKPTLDLDIGEVVTFVVKRDLLLDPSITGGRRVY